MARLLVFVPLLLLFAAAGWALGRSETKRAVQQATAHLQPVLTAARLLAKTDWLNNPSDAAYRARELQLALDIYDEDQRKALGPGS
jgi:hypothetical protein